MEVNKIFQGDCIEEMKKLEENSVDAIVTDPPYGLEFMGKDWDKGVPGKHFWEEMLRVLKPGGFLLSFSGTRTYHRMGVNIEDAGFEIRDMISWLYGSGFPKSLNIGKQVDKIQGNERKDLGTYDPRSKIDGCERKERPIGGKQVAPSETSKVKLTKGNSEWEGWGTALKPACEPIVVARKPLSEKNVALNVLKWGTGGINIDGCRIGTDREIEPRQYDKEGATGMNCGDSGFKKDLRKSTEFMEQGRFPANIILDEEAGKMLDEQSGEKKSGTISKEYKQDSMFDIGETNTGGNLDNSNCYGDKGGASRFFYCAKASKSERNLGCEDLQEQFAPKGNNIGRDMDNPKNHLEGMQSSNMKNNHPTVKPIKLMEYLVKLVSKEGAVVLDPFLGSGTTAIACIKNNREFIGIEKEEEYIEICEARIKPYLDQQKLHL